MPLGHVHLNEGPDVVVWALEKLGKYTRRHRQLEQEDDPAALDHQINRLY